MKKYLLAFLICIIGTFNIYAQGHSSAKASTIRFVENKGQWENNIMFRTDLPGGKLYAEKNKLTYAFYDTKILAEVHDKNHESKETTTERMPNAPSEESIMRLHAFSIDFLGSNLSPQITTQNQNAERNNYYIGNNPSNWASNVSSYGKITYGNLYANIDLSIYEHQHSLKYEFIVAPGADPSIIKLRYNGADKLFLDHGHLHIQTSVNEIVENAPYLYQTIEGREVKVSGKFVLEDSTICFKITSPYNKKYPLVIDPKLIFSTYSGSVADNWGNTAAFDNAGNMYSGGTVFNIGFPTTIGAYEQDFAGDPNYSQYGLGIDVGILKYNSTGTGLIYATYLGGYYTDVPYSLIVDVNDNLIIFGSTSSNNFPTSNNCYDNSFNGGSGAVQPVGGIIFAAGSDLFVSKLNSNGSTLLGSTYIGGSNNDGILYEGESLTKNYGDQLRGDVTVDDLGNIYVASNTRSTNFPVSAGAAQSVYRGGTTDACSFKFSSDLTTLAWSTYIGGSNGDAAYSIQVDSLYNVFIAGGTTSSNFHTTAGVLRPTYQGGIDGFITHISQDGKNILESTFIGTTSYDQAYFVQLDSLENVYILGQTRGAYPITSGTYNNAGGGQFIHKLSRDLSTSLMSTVIGSGGFNPNISLTAFLVNDCGNIFLSGWGGNINSPYYRDIYGNIVGYTYYVGGNTFNLPITPDAFQSTTDGSDFYIMALGQNASSLLYATYFGGSNTAEHVDGGTSRFDKKGIIYQSVCAGCDGNNDFPTYPNPGAWSNTNNSYFINIQGNLDRNCNNGSFKFDLVTLQADFTVMKSIDCSNNLVTLTNNSLGGKSFYWDFGDNTSSTLPGPILHTYLNPGTYNVMLVATDLTTCIGKDTVIKTVVIPPPPPLYFNTADTTICKGDSVALTATYNSSYTYQWSPATFLSATNIANPIAFPDVPYTYTVIVTDTNNCTVTKNIKVEVVELDQNTRFGVVPDCEGKFKVNLFNSSTGKVLNYNWIFGDGFASNTPKGFVEHEYVKPGTQTVYLSIESNGCYFKDTITIELEKVFIPNLITPNADGLNDVYEIKGIGQDWTLEIYNRWGKRLYKNSNYTNDWSGIELSDGVYYWLIISPNEKRCKGWLEILR